MAANVKFGGEGGLCGTLQRIMVAKFGQANVHVAPIIEQVRSLSTHS